MNIAPNGGYRRRRRRQGKAFLCSARIYDLRPMTEELWVRGETHTSEPHPLISLTLQDPLAEGAAEIKVAVLPCFPSLLQNLESHSGKRQCALQCWDGGASLVSASAVSGQTAGVSVSLLRSDVCLGLEVTTLWTIRLG